MNKFVKKIFVFSTLSLLSFIFFLKIYGGYIDFFYDKFTTPKQFSFILGDSRAFNGIMPKIIDSMLVNTKYETPTYNFSFTIAQASYGPSYLESVKRKLDTSSNNQLFILQVNPWMLANRQPNITDESDIDFVNTPPHNIVNMTSNPNFEYLIKNFDYFNFKGIFRKNSLLYKDGYLVNNNLPKNNLIFQEWKNQQLKIFAKWNEEWEISEYRVKWLENTVNYLRKYGSVIFVRMPLDKEFLTIENEFWSDFDDVIQNIAKNTNVKYLNYSAVTGWSTYDGHHFDANGAKLFTETLSNDILEN